MTNAAGARNPTTGLTPGLTVLTVGPAVKCAWCDGPIAKPRRGKRFCSDSHRQMDNEARWLAAPLAVYGALIGLTGSARVPSVRQIADALEWAGPKRRGRLMTLLGLVWVSEAREWRKGE
jgi:hypothetical protein